MDTEKLAEASRALEDAAESAADADLRERLTEQADQLGDLAARDRGPDHGRIARHQAALREIESDADGAPDERIDEAYELLNAYRETVDGV